MDKAILIVIFLWSWVHGVIVANHGVGLCVGERLEATIVMCVGGRLEVQIGKVEDLFTYIYMVHYGGS